MALAERRAVDAELKRLTRTIKVLCDEEGMASLKIALEEEKRGEEVPFEEIRGEFGAKRKPA